MDLADELYAFVSGDVKKKFAEAGEYFVQSAIDGGTYKNRTGRLRSSSEYEVSDDCLTLKNTCPYASDVEARGYEVFSTFVLETIAKLEE